MPPINNDLDVFDLAIRQITAEEFNRLARALNLSDKHRDRAYRVLVKGVPIKEVAAKDKVNYETVRLICARVAGQLRQSFPVITPEHFDTLIAEMPKLKGRNIELLRRVLVDGEKAADVAKSANIRLATLSVKVNKVRDKAITSGWCYVYGFVPEAEAAKFEALFEKAFSEYKKLK